MADNEDELSVLLHRAQQIRDLRSQPGWAILEDYVLFGSARSSANAHHRLANGFIKSMEEYSSATGFLQGIDFVLKADEEIQRLADSMRERLERRAS